MVGGQDEAGGRRQEHRDEEFLEIGRAGKQHGAKAREQEQRVVLAVARVTSEPRDGQSDRDGGGGKHDELAPQGASVPGIRPEERHLLWVRQDRDREDRRDGRRHEGQDRRPHLSICGREQGIEQDHDTAQDQRDLRQDVADDGDHPGALVHARFMR